MELYLPFFIPINKTGEYRADVGARAYHEQNDEEELVEVEECRLEGVLRVSRNFFTGGRTDCGVPS